MSEGHPPIEQLSDLVDGDLRGESAPSVERHVASCAACAATVRRLRDLIERAGSLPSSVEPPPDAWPAVRARLARRRGRVPVRPIPSWAREWGLRAAAAILLVASSSAVTVLVLRSRAAPDGRTPPQVERPIALPAEVAAVDRSYAQVVEELTSTLESQRGELAPATVATLQRALRVIDDAIAEARAALAADPRNEALLDVLSANYEQKVQLLRRASELPART